MASAKVVLSDSGGIQEETTVFWDGKTAERIAESLDRAFG